jgi:radical SAM superfamily enzyme YgiQ (UPF0313 family)
MSRIVLYEPATHRPHVFTNFRLPRLGILLLGTILKEHGHDVKVYADVVRQPSMRELLEADLVGISTIESTTPKCYEVAATLREHGVPVALGGPHATFMTDEALGHADYVFRGEAETSIVRLVEAVISGEGLDEVRGLSFRSRGEVFHNGPAETVSDLDSLPDPDFGLLVGGLSKIWSLTVVPIQTSRGCPHECFFCSVTAMFGRNMRYQSAERVLDGLERMDLRGKHVFFYDDHFAVSKRRLREMMEGIIERGMRFDWSAQARIDLARDEGLVRLMHRAGCRLLYVGIESVNPNTLKAFRKGQTDRASDRSVPSVPHRPARHVHVRRGYRHHRVHPRDRAVLARAKHRHGPVYDPHPSAGDALLRPSSQRGPHEDSGLEPLRRTALGLRAREHESLRTPSRDDAGV